MASPGLLETSTYGPTVMGKMLAVFGHALKESREKAKRTGTRVGVSETWRQETRQAQGSEVIRNCLETHLEKRS